jgi:hypothetical protein
MWFAERLRRVVAGCCCAHVPPVGPRLLLRHRAGDIGVLKVSGWPGTRNFLIHIGKPFAASGFNFAMTTKPSDALRIRIASMP